ncbi:hypothetical protein JCM3765_003607 [Sporobolomyces pararoseus]
MFGFGSKPAPQTTPQTSSEPTRTPTPSSDAVESGEPREKERRTFESLVQEELPIQRHSVNMEGGMPSCLTLFDNFLLCYSLAAQTKSLYRHGKPRDCSPKFEDFKFCMSIKSLSEEKKEEVWVKRRSEWWAERRMGRSSEDVWDAKTNVYTDPKEEREQQQKATATTA